MQVPPQQLFPQDAHWQELCQQLQDKTSLTALVLVAWQMGLHFARAVLEAQLQQRAQAKIPWETCPSCQQRLTSKGWAKRRILTLVGWVQWQRRIGRCPHHCLGSHCAPLDRQLGLAPYQQTSTECQRLGCLLAVFVPFELSSWLLGQLCGLSLSNSTLWNWVQAHGQRAVAQLEAELTALADGRPPAPEPLANNLAELPLAIAVDGVTVPFRPRPGTPAGKVRWREIKIAVLARLQAITTRTEAVRLRLQQRRLVGVLGDIDAFRSRLQLEAQRQGIMTAQKVLWISDGAPGFWCLFQEYFSAVAIGILDFYHAAEYLWKAAEAYQDGNPARTPQMWFNRMRHQLRHGFGKRIIKELDWLSKSRHTSAETKPILSRVRDYLRKHLDHIRYRDFKKQGFPLGSGMVESACKWLIQQRFKGVGMRWSEDGFNHLLQLRLAWVNQRFDALFSDEDLSLSSYSPNR